MSKNSVVQEIDQLLAQLENKQNEQRMTLRRLAEELLTDKHGISQIAFDVLCGLFDKDDLAALRRNVDATDGHFYTREPHIYWEN
jgi:hypothetical protein